MEEQLEFEIARRIWEAMNPDGIPFSRLPHRGMRERMLSTAYAILVDMGFEPCGLTMAKAGAMIGRL